MYRTVCLLALAACAVGQQYQSDPRNAAILTESRHQSGDGSFGAAYTQEDGVEFKEESLPDGTRRGSYSYVDPNGQRKTVSYTAGKNGFQASGDHIPVPVEQQAPVPSYTPLPEYNPPEYYEETPVRQSYSQPAQSRYSQSQYQAAAPARPQYQPPAPVRPQYQPPAPVRPQYTPPQPQYNPPQQQYNPPQQQYNPQPQYRAPQYSAPVTQQPYYSTTPAPHRFFPPGKLSLNRLPDGFSYTFNKA